MTQQNTNRTPTAGHVDAQYAELLEQVWACELEWSLDERIAACVKYAR